MNIIIDITLDVFYNILNFVKTNLTRFANIINFVIPFIMYFIGQQIAIDEGQLVINEWIIIPLFSFVCIFYIKSIANRIGKGIDVPIPEKRFTNVSDDGEVNVEYNRVQELILYMADLEDWLERKGLL